MVLATGDRGYAGADRTSGHEVRNATSQIVQKLERKFEFEREVVMLRDGDARLIAAIPVYVLAVLMGAVVATSGCAVNNPTDLAQRRPVIPTKITSAPRADGTSVFNKKAAARVIAQLGYGKARPREKPPGPLRAFVASCQGTTTLPCLNIFFFYRGQYAGAALAEPRSQLAVRAQDGRLVKASVPGADGGLRNVRYFWTGAEVIGLTTTGTVTVVHTPSHTLS
jgi:hypothetical protein